MSDVTSGSQFRVPYPAIPEPYPDVQPAVVALKECVELLLNRRKNVKGLSTVTWADLSTLLQDRSNPIITAVFNTILHGSGAPATTLGISGDFYIDDVAWDIYGPKTTVWPAGVSLIGPQGEQGDPGDTGPPGPPGADGTSGVPSRFYPPGIMVLRTTDGAAYATVELTADKVMLETFDFDPSTVQYVQFSDVIPNGYGGGSYVVYLHWTGADSDVGDVAWGVRTLGLTPGDGIDTLFSSSVPVVDTFGGAYLEQRTQPISGFSAPPLDGDRVVFQVFRSGGTMQDTYAHNVSLIGVEVVYSTDPIIVIETADDDDWLRWDTAA